MIFSICRCPITTFRPSPRIRGEISPGEIYYVKNPPGEIDFPPQFPPGGFENPWGNSGGFENPQGNWGGNFSPGGFLKIPGETEGEISPGGNFTMGKNPLVYGRGKCKKRIQKSINMVNYLKMWGKYQFWANIKDISVHFDAFFWVGFLNFQHWFFPKIPRGKFPLQNPPGENFPSGENKNPQGKYFPPENPWGKPGGFYFPQGFLFPPGKKTPREKFPRILGLGLNMKNIKFDDPVNPIRSIFCSCNSLINLIQSIWMTALSKCSS